ncbi:methyltransferase family protein [Nitrosomonas communis]|uniref:Protein-S-isoprenylcysteine O-methyltransferase Ste14 n=1 Tax=Nitrosomonas communis TaxID=44574 RepID=A0A1I4P3P5_9PROT|nr:methyltransferase [Nitrosomonas communis]SFM22398.1 Protein-S-isoprenylcysteine O-methyltransferase Ste14 [Nitrosomonas communis]
MNALSRIIKSPRFNVYSGVLLATLYGLFAYAHFSKFQQTNDWALLLVIIAETLGAIFFICRSDPQTVSTAPSDWLVAIIGTFAPLFLRPAEWGILPVANILIMVGTMLQIISLISLNRSFALVAAKREIKTTWMYRIVRHPLYASYSVLFGGYVLVHTTLMNLLVYIVTMVFLCIRIFREEKHLAQDQTYRTYMFNVRYRLIPFVF